MIEEYWRNIQDDWRNRHPKFTRTAREVVITSWLPHHHVPKLWSSSAHHINEYWNWLQYNVISDKFLILWKRFVLYYNHLLPHQIRISTRALTRKCKKYINIASCSLGKYVNSLVLRKLVAVVQVSGTSMVLTENKPKIRRFPFNKSLLL